MILRRLLPLAALLLVAAASPAAAQPEFVKDTSADYKAAKKLLEETLVTIDVTDMPLADLLARLQEQTGILLVLDPIAYDLDKPGGLLTSLNFENASLADVLTQAGMQWELEPCWVDGVWVMGFAESFAVHSAEIRLFDVTRLHGGPRIYGGYGLSLADDGYREEPPDRDFYPTTGDTIVSLVIETIARDSWDEPNSIDYRQGTLIVRHQPEVLDQVAALLDELQRRVDRRAEFELRVYRAPLGTGESLNAPPISSGAERDALLAALEKRATLIDVFHGNGGSGDHIEFRDTTETDRVSGRTATTNDNVTALEPVVTRITSGVQAQLDAAIDSFHHCCPVEIRVDGAPEPELREASPGKPPAAVTLAKQARWKILSSAVIPDGGTLIQWTGDDATGAEFIAALTVAIHDDTTPYAPPPMSPADAAIHEKLTKPITIDVRVVTVVDFLKQFAALTGVPLTLSESLYDEEGVYAQEVTFAADGVRASLVLDLALRANSCFTKVHRGALWAGSYDGYQALFPLQVCLFDIGGLTFRARPFQSPRHLGRPPEAPDEIEWDRDEPEPLDSDTIIELIETTIGADRWDSDRGSIAVHDGALVVVQAADIQAEVAHILDSIRDQRIAVVDVRTVRMARGEFDRLFPPGKPRRGAALTADELARIRDATPEIISTFRVAAFNEQLVYGLSFTGSEFIAGLTSSVAANAVAWEPVISRVRGGFVTEVRSRFANDGEVTVRVRGELARVLRDGRDNRTADGVESAVTQQIPLDVQETVRFGETFAAVPGAFRAGVGGDSAPVVLLVTPRLVTGP